MFPHTLIPHPRDHAKPTNPLFWDDVYRLAADPAWVTHCSSTGYSSPTSTDRVIADLSAATRLNCLPRFAGSPAWARYVLETVPPCRPHELATVVPLRPRLSATTQTGEPGAAR